MLVLILGLILFLGMHSISIVKVSLRDDLVARFGEWPWKAIYGLVSLLGFALIVYGYGLARATPILLYDPPAWLRHLNLLLMLPVFTLLLATYLPGRIQSAAKHPMLLAVKLWATAHLLANGTLADVVLFGSFLAWAVADRISLKRRSGPTVPGAPASPINDAIAIIGGLFLYLLFMFWLHRVLMGVPPIG
ncbi:NnrU family protein [Thiocapsa imhoffii]|uniref:NnrU family protein n=1 Tax=Thiocapsa imhoffii TaxID=382777 RepID=A0A9X0WJB9_9GAMM|nr:NnrU family protein [Thiocapsa imhoffii]MBK1645535.1 NnrU family protein [Thiocapsa imhoffii]